MAAQVCECPDRLNVRFGVLDSHGAVSAVWQAWTNRNRADMYLAIRGLGDKVKISLHERGWRVAWTDRYAQSLHDVQRGRDRAFMKWTRPAPLAPGLVVAYRILVPASELRAAQGKSHDRLRSMHWHDAPIGDNAMTEFAVLLTSPELPLNEDWPGQRHEAAALVGHAVLPTAETVWIVARDLETGPAEENARLRAEWRAHQRRWSETVPAVRASYRHVYFGLKEGTDAYAVDLAPGEAA